MAAAREAATQLVLDQHRPWLPSLPERLPWHELASGACGLLDDPDHQSQAPWTWSPAGAHLLCIGTVGAGTTTALASMALAAAAVHSPAQLHVYVLDGGSALHGLGALPHVGAVIGPTEGERQARLIDRLEAKLDRSGSHGPDPLVLVVVDRLDSWRQAVSDRLGPHLADRLDRILVEGPAAGVVVAGGLDRPGGLPAAVTGAVGERLVMRLADPSDAVGIGVPPGVVANLPAGRAVLARCGRTVQLALLQPMEAAVAEVARRWEGADCSGAAPCVAALPERVPLVDLVRPDGRADRSPPWRLVLGVGAELEPVHLVAHPGDHLLIAGPARSGRSSALALLARQLVGAGSPVRLLGLAPARSPLADSADLEVVGSTSRLADLLGMTRPDGGRSRTVILVDDAERVDDPSHVLSRLLEGEAGPLTVMAAGRSDALRAAYGHWTQSLRRLRRGIILRPDGDADGDVLGVALPRWEATPVATGRGYLVGDGHRELVQLASLDP